jgi:SAM-dependent methyltransferase
MIGNLLSRLKMWKRRHFPNAVVRMMQAELGAMESILDVGCGSDSPLQWVRTKARKTGFDAFEPSVAQSRAKGIHDEYVVKPLENMDFAPGSFDAVIAMDLIEHFEKQASLRLVARLEQIARRKVILFTPNGFLPQTVYEDNPWQEHLCGWTVEEFEQRGYRVRGALGFKRLRGEFHLPRLRPHFIFERIANLSRFLLTAGHPKLDAALFAVKDISKAL